MIPVVGATRSFDLIVFAVAAVLYLIELMVISRVTHESVFMRRYCGAGFVLSGIIAVLSYSGIPRTDTIFQIVHSLTVLQTLGAIVINAGLGWANSRVLNNQSAGVWLFLASLIAMLVAAAEIATFFI
jgi:multisubunit Na+/H+ antiporter MnhG subunit